MKKDTYYGVNQEELQRGDRALSLTLGLPIRTAKIALQVYTDIMRGKRDWSDFEGAAWQDPEFVRQYQEIQQLIQNNGTVPAALTRLIFQGSRRAGEVMMKLEEKPFIQKAEETGLRGIQLATKGASYIDRTIQQQKRNRIEQEDPLYSGRVHFETQKGLYTMPDQYTFTPADLDFFLAFRFGLEIEESRAEVYGQDRHIPAFDLQQLLSSNGGVQIDLWENRIDLPYRNGKRIELQPFEIDRVQSLIDRGYRFSPEELRFI